MITLPNGRRNAKGAERKAADKNMIIVLDLETTGLTLPSCANLDQQPRIIEIGAVRIRSDGKILDSYSQQINPGIPLDPVITKITGLTDADLADKPAFKDIGIALPKYFGECDTLVAHNAPFDTAVLAYELQRAGVNGFPWPPVIVCTVQEFYHLHGRNMKLTELYEEVLGEPLKQDHRALSDVMALVSILNKTGLLYDPA